MFRINDVIIYGAQGVCRIADVEEKTISGTKKTYFVLKPVADSGSTIYAPADNATVLKKMRRLLSKDEVDALIDSMKDEHMAWTTNENERKESYKKILGSGDYIELIRMLKAIYTHKIEREADGKRLHMTDERFLKEAEQMLYSEFQYVLQLRSKEELTAYIAARIENSDG